MRIQRILAAARKWTAVHGLRRDAKTPMPVLRDRGPGGRLVNDVGTAPSIFFQ